MSYITMEQRGKDPLSTNMYSFAQPWPRVILEAPVPKVKSIPTDLYILRMMVKAPLIPLRIPPNLMWLKESVVALWYYQKSHFPDHPYIYITVRNGLVSSTTDDQWHVDGFSMRIPHTPEQNYIYISNHPTEWLRQNIYIPNDFNPLKHNLHWWIQDCADKTKKRNGVCGAWTLFDPYVIHRRPPNTNGIYRQMIRISFVPIEIQDNTCTVNPLIAPKVYDQEDIRNRLERYYKSW